MLHAVAFALAFITVLGSAALVVRAGWIAFSAPAIFRQDFDKRLVKALIMSLVGSAGLALADWIYYLCARPLFSTKPYALNVHSPLIATAFYVGACSLLLFGLLHAMHRHADRAASGK